MIEFLRMRKEIKRIEEERLARLKQKKIESEKAKRTVGHGTGGSSPRHSDSGGSPHGKNGMNGGLKGLNLDISNNNVIAEADDEHEGEEKNGILGDVQNLVKESKAHLT